MKARIAAITTILILLSLCCGLGALPQAMLSLTTSSAALAAAPVAAASGATIQIISKDTSNQKAESNHLSPLELGGICLGIFIALLILLQQINARFHLTLHGKMLLMLGGVFSLFLVYSLLSYFSIYNLRTISGELEQLAKTKLPVISYITQITEQQSEQKVFFERYLRTRANPDREMFLSFDGRIKKVIASASEYLGEAEVNPNAAGEGQFLAKLQRDMGDIKQQHQVFIDNCDRLIVQLAQNASMQLSEVTPLMERCTLESEQLGNKVIEFLTSLQDEVHNTTTATLNEEKYTIELIIAIALFSLLWGLFVLLSIWRSSTTVIRHINSSITTLHHSSQEVGSASDNLIASSSTLEKIAHEQTATVSAAANSVERNEEITRENLTRVESSNELSQKISLIAAKAETSMNSLVDSMNKITESNDRIQQLVAIIEDIGEKTRIIDEIVFQTKLLSFNTAVEAERAGEHGRGFAVIAQEVGKLAQMSGAASKEISHMVTQTKEAAQVIAKENRERVSNGNQLVQETGEILKEISNSSHSVIESAGQILQTSQEQQRAISQLNGSLTAIDKATHHNLAMAQQTAEASTLLNQQSRNLHSIVETLMAAIMIKR